VDTLQAIIDDLTAKNTYHREETFLVPKEGGVLQKMKKDLKGNIKLRLGKKIKITHDTYIFRFSFEDPD
jgi:hypothetical protein